MPAWGTKNGGLRPGEIEEILKFLRSHEAVPPSLAEVRAAKGDPVRGERLFVGNCSACHGNDGTGTDLAPGVANPDLLATASEEFLYTTVVHGRPGTAMPSHKELSASDVASILAWLDTHRKGPRKDLGDVRAVGSVAYGREVYATQCASCHGADASGGVGPAIGNRHFLGVASDGFLAASIREGRSGRAMKPFGRGRGGIVELEEREIMDVIVYLRSLDPGGEEPIRKGEVKGDVAAGKQNFAAMCAGCHGAGGKGGFAPSLANPGFLAAASDGFLQATILKGRAGTAMRSWGNHGFAELSPRDVNDLTAYIRSLERKDTP